MTFHAFPSPATHPDCECGAHQYRDGGLQTIIRSLRKASLRSSLWFGFSKLQFSYGWSHILYQPPVVHIRPFFHCRRTATRSGSEWRLCFRVGHLDALVPDWRYSSIDMVSRLVKLVSIDVALITMMMPVSAWPIIPYLPGSSINVSFAGWHIDTRR